MRQHLSNLPGVAQKPVTSESDSNGGERKEKDDPFGFEKKPRSPRITSASRGSSNTKKAPKLNFASTPS